MDGAVISPTPYQPPTHLQLTKEQAGDLAIGEHVKISISGKVVGISQTKSWDQKKKKDVVTGYDVQLEDSSVVDIATNPARKSLEEMKKQ